MGSVEFASKIKRIITELSDEEKEDIKYINKGLSVLALHAKAPVDRMNSNFSWREDEYNAWMENSVSVGVSLDGRTDILYRATKEALALRDNSDIIPSIAKGMNSINNIHHKIRGELEQRVQETKEIIENAMAEYASSSECPKGEIPKRFNVYKHYYGVEIEFMSESGSFTWIDVIEYLQTLYSWDLDLSKWHSETVFRRGKNLFSGCIFSLAGRFPDRQEMVSSIERRAGQVSNSISKATTMLIAGKNSSEKKLDLAKKYDIPIIAVDVFAVLINASEYKTDRRITHIKNSDSVRDYIENLFRHYNLTEHVNNGIFLA